MVRLYQLTQQFQDNLAREKNELDFKNVIGNPRRLEVLQGIIKAQSRSVRNILRDEVSSLWHCPLRHN